jgi:hypothetical protein
MRCFSIQRCIKIKQIQLPKDGIPFFEPSPTLSSHKKESEPENLNRIDQTSTKHQKLGKISP